MSNQKKKILVVDDDQDILEPLSLLLVGEGYDVLVTHKGDETYEKVSEFQPDIILLDLLMSGSDGRKICVHLKNNIETKNIPILVMSAHPNAEDSTVTFADGFVAKPFEIHVLTEQIKSMLV